MIYAILVAVVISAESSTACTAIATAAKDEECVTRNGVTHCWENFGSWDPRPAPSEWPENNVHASRVYEPKAWGSYATEQRSTP